MDSVPDELMQKYFGIELQDCSCNSLDSLKTLIHESLKENRPILIQVNLFNYPLSPSFKIHRASHSYLISGMEDEDTILITDPSYDVSGKPLSLSDNYPFMEDIKVFSSSNSFFSDNIPDWKKIFSDNIQKLPSSQSVIAKNARELQENYESLTEDQFQQHAKYAECLVNNRFLFQLFAENFVTDKSFLSNIDFSVCAKNFSTIKNSILKLQISKQKERILVKLQQKISTALEEERQLSELLQKKLL